MAQRRRKTAAKIAKSTTPVPRKRHSERESRNLGGGGADRAFRPPGSLDSTLGMTTRGLEATAHVLPLHDLVVDLAQAAADHAAEQIQKLQRRVRIHREDLVQR